MAFTCPLQSTQCIGVFPKTSDDKIVRRSSNYKPPIWDYNFVQSLCSKYVGDTYVTQATKLKEDVKKIFKAAEDSMDKLEMIDDLQRLGVFYHFEDEIKKGLESIYNNKHDRNDDDLHATSLKFRLLRQHGYNVPQEVFNNFMDEKGRFKAYICEDIRGMLYLYEASFLSFSGEGILEEAKEFATKNLEQYLKRMDIDQHLALLISHALELPLYWRTSRLEARWFIDLCERRQNMTPTLLQFAKLDYNMVQATYQEELKHSSRWWNKTGLGKKLSFCRDRVIENFFWSTEENFKPQSSKFRINMTVLNAMITVMDDLYDIYGTLDELEVFTNAVERWDIGAMEQLPDYMKTCFLALFNSINEMGYETLMEQDVHIIPNLQKEWADLCKSYLKEAKWYYSGYKPTLEEYLDNAFVTSTASLLLTHSCLWENPINKEGLDWLVKNPGILRWSANIYRLTNDLGTSPEEIKRGDSPKSIQCYMYETGANEEDARDHMKHLIWQAWKRSNEEYYHSTDSPLSQTAVEIAMDVSRTSMCFYLYGDAYAGQGCEVKERLLSVFIDPIPLEF